ncbi:MAG TPA: ATP-binding protein, partial [Legionellaceae bacterium]|nr:ATP-binding protein [Legionellaceae bacterium]
MQIQFIEIQNFRKLKSIRIDFDKQTTVFVGANNSGKTSAMVALGHFLIDNSRFTTNDFTLSNWSEINKIGKTWETPPVSGQTYSPDLSEWAAIVPTMDIWINVAPNEIHYVQHLMPTLKWNGGLLGVRMRLEPQKIQDLYKEFLLAREASSNTIAEAKKLKGETAEYTLPLWPLDMGQFLERKLNAHFEVKAYILDPTKLQLPSHGLANPQILPIDREPISGNPFKGLIKINEIDAQRGFSDASSSNDSSDSYNTGGKRKLSDQLRSYYTRHIDPSETPEPSDIDALQALHEAQNSFDQRLGTSFEAALAEIKDLGYPGVTDLELVLSTKIHPMDGLNHDSALKYKVRSNPDKEEGNHPCLPEQYNGLGYQNLISMVFRLMSFRDHWMQVGKSAKAVKTANDFIPPLHLVLVEEPEAHLHVQVQQVFIRKAYSILRSHKDLGTNKNL